MRGGGLRCTGYLGVLKAFEEYGIQVDMIIGSSMGAVIGTLYALGFSIQRMIDLEKSINFFTFLSLNGVKDGSLLSGSKLEKEFEKLISKKRIEEAKIKTYIQCTDLIKHRPEIFSTGKAAQLMAASCAFPMLISPLKIGHRLFLDGDISAGYSAEFLRKNGADVVIGLYPGSFLIKIFMIF